VVSAITPLNECVNYSPIFISMATLTRNLGLPDGCLAFFPSSNNSTTTVTAPLGKNWTYKPSLYRWCRLTSFVYFLRWSYGTSKQSNTVMIISDAFQDTSYWRNFMPYPNWDGVIMDSHFYQVFSNQVCISIYVSMTRITRLSLHRIYVNVSFV
jgi:hypothetical protein